MEVYKKTNPFSADNPPVICVTIDSNEENTDIWNNCISSEFPIINVDMNEYEAICQIGSPHQGYTLKTSQKNDILDGDAFLYDYDNRVVAIFTYQEGVENGKCRMYYRSGEIYFSGFLREGYRNGPGVEYRKDRSVIYEGFYKNGRQAPNIKLRLDGSNYWDEKDQYGEMVSMFQIDDIGLHHGICYIYYNGEISKISRWKHGKEMELLQKFDGLTMQMFENGKEVFSGRYYRKSDFEYVPIYPTETNTVRVSKEANRGKERDCKCINDRCKKSMVKIICWMSVIAAGDYCLAVILFVALSWWEPFIVIGNIMIGLGIFLFLVVIVSSIIYSIVQNHH